MANNDHHMESPRRWTAKRKMELVLRVFRGESIDDVSRSAAIPSHKLDEWRQEALQNLEAGLKHRVNDPTDAALSRAKEQTVELSMENELLRRRVEKAGPKTWQKSPLQ